MAQKKVELSLALITGMFAALQLCPVPLVPQSPKKPTTNSKTVQLAPCASFGNPKSCVTFNALLVAHDADFTDLEKVATAYVCFRPSIDSFFRIDFEPFNKSWSKSQPSTADLQDILSLDSYLSGQDNGDYLAVLKWSWVKDFPDSAEATLASEVKDHSGIQDVRLTETTLHLTVKFKNIKDEEVTQVINIRRSTGRYSMDTSRSVENDHEDGACVKYPRQQKRD